MSIRKAPPRLSIGREQDWRLQSDRDLEVAGFCLVEGFYEWVCFSAHQAAEKRLKGLLCRLEIIEAEIKGIKGHDLVYVGRFIPKYLFSDVATFEDHCTFLTGVSLKSRYPDSYPVGCPGALITEQTAREAISAAEAILAEVENITNKL